MAHLWRPSPAPVTWWAPTTLSRATRTRWLHPELHPSFSSSQCRPLGWQRGVTQGQTPSGVTQIQPLAELLPPPGPTTPQANGGEVRRSGGHGGNSPGVSHLPKPRLAGVHRLGPRMWTLSMATHKLLTQQMRGTDNSRPWERPTPWQALLPPPKQVSAWPDGCQHLAPFTHALGNSLGERSSTEP